MKVKTTEHPRIRIAAVGSDPLRFIGLQALLGPEKDFDLESTLPGDFDALVHKDVVLIAERCGTNPFELIETLKAKGSKVCVVVIGSAEDDEAILRAIAGGARGYVNEGAPALELAHAIRSVNQGLVWASRRIFSSLIDRASSLTRHKFMPDALTNREKEVLKMLVAGRSNKEIGLPLGIEERTVKAHVSKLMRKLGVQNRIMLSVHAVTHSLVAAE